MAWRVAKSLLKLRDQVNAAAPNRSKLSDGTIGDAAHASRSSDHNPWVKDGSTGVVTAIDLTHDPAHGADMHVVSEALRRSGDPRRKYLIWNRRIASSIAGWAWRPYSGSNPHTKHMHLSVQPTKSLYDNTGAWSIAPKPKPEPKPEPLPRPGARMLMEDDMLVYRQSDGPCWWLVKPGPSGYRVCFPGGYGTPVARQYGGAANIPEATGEEISKLAPRKVSWNDVLGDGDMRYLAKVEGHTYALHNNGTMSHVAGPTTLEELKDAGWQHLGEFDARLTTTYKPVNGPLA